MIDSVERATICPVEQAFNSKAHSPIKAGLNEFRDDLIFMNLFVLPKSG